MCRDVSEFFTNLYGVVCEFLTYHIIGTVSEFFALYKCRLGIFAYTGMVSKFFALGIVSEFLRIPLVSKFLRVYISFGGSRMSQAATMLSFPAGRKGEYRTPV